MSRKSLCAACLTVFLSFVNLGFGQDAVSANAAPVVPNMINFGGVLTDLNARPLAGVQGVTFLLYRTQQGGTPLWMETQNVTPGKGGQYTVVLGAASAHGLPADLFASGEGRWLAVQIAGQPEQPRVMLVAVPYALKAADAQTIGGLPPSAFLRAAPPNVGAPADSPAGAPALASALPSSPLPPASNVTTTGGSVGTIPMFTATSNIQNSILTQSGTTAINVIGKLNLPAIGLATASKGFSSRPESHVASVFNSSLSSPITQIFQWQAEPAGNNTAAPSATMNLLFASGNALPSETGLRINSKGQIAFATGQTFPGTGRGTITGVTAGTDLTGGGSSGNVTLNLDTTKVPQLNTPNQFTQTLSVAVNNPFAGALNATSAYEAIVGTMTTNDFLTAAVTGNASATGAGSSIGTAGFSGTDSGYGVYGSNSSSGTGVYGTASGFGGIGIYGSAPSGTAGYFSGNVQVTGLLTSYNGHSTVANGVTSIIAEVAFSSNGSGNNIYTTIYTPPNDGVFRIIELQECTGTSGGATIFSTNFQWTLPTGALGFGQVQGGGCASLNLGETGSVLAHVKGGTPIQFNYAGMDAPFETVILIEQLL
jgi:hypothetical protein